MEQLTHIDNERLLPLVVAKGEDCWNHSGVWGRETPRCSRLNEVLHCRNCEIFTRAGRRLFDSAANINYGTEWRDVTRTAEQPFVRAESYMVFRLGREWLALDSRVIQQINEAGATHSIPHRDPSHLRGVMNIHGELLPWINLEGLLTTSMSENDDVRWKLPHRCIVVGSDQQRFVFSINAVEGMARPEQLREPPAALLSGRRNFVDAVFEWLGRSVGRLNGDTLLRAFGECL